MERKPRREVAALVVLDIVIPSFFVCCPVRAIVVFM